MKKTAILLATISFVLSGLTACGFISQPSKKENLLKADSYNGEIIDLTPIAYKKYLKL